MRERQADRDYPKRFVQVRTQDNHPKYCMKTKAHAWAWNGQDRGETVVGRRWGVRDRIGDFLD